MNKFGKMLDRVNLQSIGSYIQMGAAITEVDANNLEERENQAVRILKQRLTEKVPEVSCKSVMDIAMEYANDCSEIYFTLGMKAGAKIMFQLLNDSLKDN